MLKSLFDPRNPLYGFTFISTIRPDCPRIIIFIDLYNRIIYENKCAAKRANIIQILR